MISTLDKCILEFKHQLETQGIDPSQGLGKELFEFISTLTPMPNVDLLVESEKGILFSWRDDECGQGWHIPGGVIRYQESLDQRLHTTAIDELGADISYDKDPIKIVELIKNDVSYREWPSKGRGHAISILYRCQIIDESKLLNCDDQEIAGHLSWFKSMPDKFLKVQEVYRDILEATLEHV